MNGLQVLLYRLPTPNCLKICKVTRHPYLFIGAKPIRLTIISSSWQYGYSRQTASADEGKGFPCIDFQPDVSCAPYPGSSSPFRYVLEFSFSPRLNHNRYCIDAGTARALSLPTRTFISTLSSNTTPQLLAFAYLSISYVPHWARILSLPFFWGGHQ